MKNEEQKEKNAIYKKRWFWIIIAIIAILLVILGGRLNTSNTRTDTLLNTTNKTNSTINNLKNQTKTTSNASNVMQNDAENTSSEPKGEDIILTLGTYEVGVDIKSGKYDLIAQSGMGNVITKGSTYNSIMLSINETEYYSTKYNNLKLKDGDKVEIINKLTVLFQAK